MGIFSNIFGHRKDISNYQVDDNPWAGLSSYEDPEEAEREGRKPKLFCGRDEESHNVAQLIAGNIFVTLYGKSGTGKTSLLNAGVFPLLRQKRYLPVSIRLSMDALGISFQQCILHKLAQAVMGHQGRLETINVVDMPEDEQQPDYLWSYFARTRFVNRNGQTVFPVIVFDQFEEVFRNRKDDAETLLRQIAYLMDESHALTPRQVDGRPYQYDFNFRVVTSIREDDLYRLEDSIDNLYLPALKRCRYRLRSLKEEEAMDVILIPGEGLFLPEERKVIAKSIIDNSHNKDGSISTNVISLLCSRIFVDFQRSGAGHINPQLVESFLKGNPFEKFYDEATHGFSNREKSYIEDHLVDSTGRRNSISEGEFLKHVKNGAVLLEGERKILQRTSTSSDSGNYRVELIHDSFCEPLSIQKEKREKRKRRRQMAGIAGVALLSLGIITLVLYQMHRVNKANWEMMENRARFVSEKALALVDEGDSYLARLLLLEVLPENLEHPDRPCVFEAENALRTVLYHHSAVLRGHTGQVCLAAFSPDGKRIVSASADETIRIWDAETGQQIGLPLEGHASWGRSASFSPDGKRIVSASPYKTISIWDAETGRQIGQPLEGHFNSVLSVSFSPDGKRIVSASADNTIRIWDTETGRKIGQHSCYVNTVSFSPDGKYIVSASADRTIRIWDAKTWHQKVQLLQGHTGNINSASFSPDGKCIVSASDDNTIRIWDAETGHQKGQPLEGHTDYVFSASFSPDGKYIVSASADRTIRIWNAETRLQIGPPLKGHTDYVYSASFSPDGKRIVSASWDKTIRIWDAEIGRQDGQPLKGHTGPVLSASFSPNGKRIVSASGNYFLHIVRSHLLKHVFSLSADKTIRIWDAETGQQIGKSLEAGNVYSTSFSPDGKRIVSASADKTIRIWDAATRCQIGKPLVGHTSNVLSASFSPDGKRIVSASLDKTIRIWDVETGHQIGQPLEGHTSDVYSASFSPDGKRIVSASADNTLRIWDAATMHQIGQPLVKHTDVAYSASFSPDGMRIVSASADKTILIWDAETGHQIGPPLEGHTDCVYSASFSPDGKRIVSASMDKTIRIWDSETGYQIGPPLKGHTDYVYSASFSPDGKRIVSSSLDNTIRIWDFPPLQQLIDETRERFKNRQLTPEERRKYYLE